MSMGVFGRNNRHDDSDEDDLGSVKFEINFNGYLGDTCDLQTYVVLDECDEYAISAFERACTQLGINFGAGYFVYDSFDGYFVDTINGLAIDGDNSLYWFLYLNGEKANFGISDLTIEPDDVLTWSYEVYST